MVKKIAVIQDLSGFGKCSLTAVIPVLAVMGIQACPLPTAVLSAQTGYPSYYMDDFTDRMEYFRLEWEKMKVDFDAIYTGFIASEQQIENIFRFLDSFSNDENFLIVDPVLGDDGEVYDMFTPKLCQQMVRLAERADVITPNVTELCLLCGEEYKKVAEQTEKEAVIQMVKEMALRFQKRGPRRIIVTGIHFVENGVEQVANLALDDDEILLYQCEKMGCSYSGTGDLFASVVTGGSVRGDSLQEILEEAGEFLQKSIADAAKEGIPGPDGVNFEKFLHLLMK